MRLKNLQSFIHLFVFCDQWRHYRPFLNFSQYKQGQNQVKLNVMKALSSTCSKTQSSFWRCYTKNLYIPFFCHSCLTSRLAHSHMQVLQSSRSFYRFYSNSMDEPCFADSSVSFAPSWITPWLSLWSPAELAHPRPPLLLCRRLLHSILSWLPCSYLPLNQLMICFWLILYIRNACCICLKVFN